jgi:hypothetical protein
MLLPIIGFSNLSIKSIHLGFLRICNSRNFLYQLTKKFESWLFQNKHLNHQYAE